ncbi:MAG: adenylate/guanylate cyclase domain-containing protein, partial [Anaerolineae bacterium]|nr:adenylate/guanylate cyclase domain-containing protein [Anaerolineae bacterium]
MSSPLTDSHPAIPSSSSLEERIKGTIPARILHEFVVTSALFPILDAIRVISTEGIGSYLAEPAHYILFVAAFVQAWFLGTAKNDTWQTKFVGNLLGFMLYVPLDMTLEGFGFFSQSYHWLFGGFSLLMAILSAGQHLSRNVAVWQTITTLLLNVGKTSLFPAMYLIVELGLEVSPQRLTWAAWTEYISTSGHRFIFYGVLFFGLLLGLAESQRSRYAQSLRYLARQLKMYGEWSLGSQLITTAIDNPTSLDLQRVKRTILFMDIRGFTAWTEKTDPQRAVTMLNRYYNAAELIISSHGGHKPNFTADEVMTRFTSAEAGLATALELQQALKPVLSAFNLAVGIGLHTGEVIEGLMGSDNTRKYDIIGDAVNTAKRLESAAGQGQVVLSAVTYQALPELTAVSPLTLQVKGKT